MNIKKDENGLYYILDYYPTRYHRSETVEFLKFKENEDEAIVNKFCKMIAMALWEIVKEINFNRIALVPVPRSSMYKESTLAIKLMNIIGILEEDPLDFTVYYDCTGLIFRDSQCQTSHSSNIRPTFEEQFLSLKFDNDKIVKEDVIYILVDDIVTRGITLKACEQHLSDNGIPKDKILKFAVAKTIR